MPVSLDSTPMMQYVLVVSYQPNVLLSAEAGLDILDSMFLVEEGSGLRKSLLEALQLLA